MILARFYVALEKKKEKAALLSIFCFFVAFALITVILINRVTLNGIITIGFWR